MGQGDEQADDQDRGNEHFKAACDKADGMLELLQVWMGWFHGNLLRFFFYEIILTNRERDCQLISGKYGDCSGKSTRPGKVYGRNTYFTSYKKCDIIVPVRPVLFFFGVFF